MSDLVKHLNNILLDWDSLPGGNRCGMTFGEYAVGMLEATGSLPPSPEPMTTVTEGGTVCRVEQVWPFGLSCEDHYRLVPLPEPCHLCYGIGCEESCGLTGGCESAFSGPDSHKVCARCQGSGRETS